MQFIRKYDEQLVTFIKLLTAGFIDTRLGHWFLALSLVGPITFIPTVIEAWTAPNIDALRTLTWPLMTLVNISVLVAMCYNGDWRVRLSMLIWTVLMLLMWLATIVR